MYFDLSHSVLNHLKFYRLLIRNPPLHPAYLPGHLTPKIPPFLEHREAAQSGQGLSISSLVFLIYSRRFGSVISGFGLQQGLHMNSGSRKHGGHQSKSCISPM